MTEREKMESSIILSNDITEENVIPSEEPVDMYFLSYIICKYLHRPSDTDFLLKMMAEASFDDVEYETGYSRDEQIAKMDALQREKLINFKYKAGRDCFKMALYSDNREQTKQALA